MKLANGLRFLFLASLLFPAMLLQSGTMANADWREEMGRMRIGFLDKAAGAEPVLQMEPFRLAIEEKLGLTIELVPFANLAGMARAQAAARLEYAIYPATTYAATWINCECIEPLVVPAAGDGSTATRSILITRRNSAIRSPADLQGRSVWVLRKEGIIAERFAFHAMKSEAADLDTAMIEVLSADNPRSVIERFAAGEGDALIGWSSMQGEAATGYSRGTARLLAEIAGGFENYSITWQSPALPHPVHAIRKNMDAQAKNLLREVLTQMNVQDPVAYDAVEPVFEGGLQTVPHAAFQPAIAFVRSLLPEDARKIDMDDGSTDTGSGNTKSESNTPDSE